MQWTEDNLATCVSLAKSGMSATQIAATFKGGFSRNAIIGKMHRSGFRLGDVNGNSSIKVAKKITVPKPEKRLMLNRANKIVDIRYAEETPVIIDVRREDGVALLDLGESQCRWPFGQDDDVWFCGRQKLDGVSYCLSHYVRSRRDVNATAAGYARVHTSREHPEAGIRSAGQRVERVASVLPKDRRRKC